MKTNKQFKMEARAALRGNWGKAVLVTLIYTFLMGAVMGPTMYQSAKMQTYVREHHVTNLHQMATMMQDPAYQLLQQRTNGSSSLLMLVQILFIFPLSLGYANAMRKLLVDGDNEMLGNTFHIAFTNYWHKVWGMLWRYILIFLWTLLLIIPGIIKSFSYAMTPFILEENPELSASEAIHRSRMMMRGHKFDLFWLFLGFLGWFILCLFTAGIGFFWLAPYMETAYAGFYEEVKAEYELSGGLD